MGEVRAPFFGRSGELERLGAAVGHARNRRADALVVVGTAGVGKTTLIDAFLADAALGPVRAVRVAGYSAEADLPYAALDRLLLELRDELDALPPKLAAGLAVARGRQDGEPPDRFQVGLALLSVLGAATAPTVCVVDDAHLLDGASLAALGFAARRLKAEPVAMVFTSRPDPAGEDALAGIDEIRLDGLDIVAAVQLLNHGRPEPLDPRLAATVVEQLEGHPLALADLARHSDADRLALRALATQPPPPGALLESHYRSEIDFLPGDARDVMLLAVADTTGDFPALKNPANYHKAVGFTKDEWHYAFANTLSREESDAAWERYAIAAPGNWVFAYGLLANFQPGHQATWVDYSVDRAPLLFIGGSEDHIMPPSVNKSNAKHWQKSPALTEYHEFEGRGHWTCAEPGWQAVADYALDWTLAHARPVTTTTNA